MKIKLSGLFYAGIRVRHLLNKRFPRATTNSLQVKLPCKEESGKLRENDGPGER